MCPCTVELLPYRFFFLSFSRVTWTFFRPFFPQFRFSLSLSLSFFVFLSARSRHLFVFARLAFPVPRLHPFFSGYKGFHRTIRRPGENDAILSA